MALVQPNLISQPNNVRLSRFDTCLVATQSHSNLPQVHPSIIVTKLDGREGQSKSPLRSVKKLPNVRRGSLPYVHHINAKRNSQLLQNDLTPTNLIQALAKDKTTQDTTMFDMTPPPSVSVNLLKISPKRMSDVNMLHSEQVSKSLS